MPGRPTRRKRAPAEESVNDNLRTAVGKLSLKIRTSTCARSRPARNSTRAPTAVRTMSIRAGFGGRPIPRSSSCCAPRKETTARSTTSSPLPKTSCSPSCTRTIISSRATAIPLSKPQLFHIAAGKHICRSPTSCSPNPWSITDVRWVAGFRAASRFSTTSVGTRCCASSLSTPRPARRGPSSMSEPDTSSITPASIYLDYLQTDARDHLDVRARRLESSLPLRRQTGKVKNQITQGPWVVRGVEQVDEDEAPDLVPRRRHPARAGPLLCALLPGELRRHRTGQCSPRATARIACEFSPDRAVFRGYAGRGSIMPPVHDLRQRGRRRPGLRRWNGPTGAALLATGWRAPERFVAKGPRWHRRIFTASSSGRRTSIRTSKYPVIEEIYAGPQGAFVPKAFSSLLPPQCHG